MSRADGAGIAGMPGGGTCGGKCGSSSLLHQSHLANAPERKMGQNCREYIADISCTHPTNKRSRASWPRCVLCARAAPRLPAKARRAACSLDGFRADAALSALRVVTRHRLTARSPPRPPLLRSTSSSPRSR
jgi:hypothetical protein